MSTENNPAKTAELVFIKFAKSKGYTHKVVGDFAYSRINHPSSPYIKLWSAKNGNLQIFETGLGRYEIPIKSL